MKKSKCCLAGGSKACLSLSRDSGLAGNDLDLVRFDRVLFEAECGVRQHKGPDIVQRAVVVQVGLDAEVEVEGKDS